MYVYIDKMYQMQPMKVTGKHNRFILGNYDAG